VVLLWAAVHYGKRAFLVAPDRVGCQVTTLVRMRRYAERVGLLAALGAQIIVPVQKGELPMSEMFRRSVEILGVSDAIAGVPMKKDATSTDDLRELVGSLPRYARVHLLGLGPESPRFAPAVAAIKALRPDSEVTSDSVTLRRLVGRTNGPGGGPRVLTKCQDAVRASGVSNSLHVKSLSLWWQACIELGVDMSRESHSITTRNELRVEVDEASARRARLAAAPTLRVVTEAA
jgi:hypothetical protein